MLLVTTNDIENKKVTKTLGLVFGACVQTRHIGKDIGASLRTIVGGEVKGYTEMIESSKQIALDRIIEQAKKLGANAIVCIRFGTTQTMPGASEIICYGSAVYVE